MTLVEGNGIAGHKTTHDLTQWSKAGSEQQMKVIGNKCPSVALSLSFIEHHSKAFQKGIAILVVPKDFSTFDPPSHYMLQDTGSIKSGLAGHNKSSKILAHIADSSKGTGSWYLP